MSKVLYVRRDDHLAHHGVKGQKWGVRRYQDEDGNLTEAGRKRYSGKHGVEKYVVDNSERLKKARQAGWTAASLSSGMMAGQIVTNSELSAAQKAAGVAFVTAGGLLGGLAGEKTGRKINEYQVSRLPQWQNEMDNARRYLRSQGIDVPQTSASRNNASSSQSARYANETAVQAARSAEAFRQQQLMFDRQQRLGF